MTPNLNLDTAGASIDTGRVLVPNAKKPVAKPMTLISDDVYNIKSQSELGTHIIVEESV